MAAVSIAVTSGHRTVVSVAAQDPQDAERLLGKDGEHLRALNTVLHRLVEKEQGEAVSFLIDVNGYHEAAAEGVRASARVLAQRARLFKHDIEMEPMSAYNRLVIHELFAAEPEIQTSSAGEGAFRHIMRK